MCSALVIIINIASLVFMGACFVSNVIFIILGCLCVDVIFS